MQFDAPRTQTESQQPELQQPEQQRKSPAARDPLHGITLETMLKRMVARYGWEEMGDQIPIRCFLFEPSIKSSLAFLRRTPWARKKVEDCTPMTRGVFRWSSMIRRRVLMAKNRRNALETSFRLPGLFRSAPPLPGIFSQHPAVNTGSTIV